MQNKLKELTDKLYKEGLSKGREEGERILEEARKKADSILAAAKSEAESVRKKAAKDADDLRSKAESDIRMASAQALQTTRKEIEDLLLNSICAKGASSNSTDGDVVKEMMLSVAKGFNATEATDLEAVLPESLKEKIEPWVKSELKKILGKEVKASFSRKINGGFTIGPADGSYFVSLSDETFRALITEYLRPVTKKILFGE